jgi:exosortase A-associated hydrolase 2
VGGEAGRLAVVLVEPPTGQDARFAVLHVPAFAEEMNKSRRSVALLARALALAGGVTAVLDLRGTGDSDGDHGLASWQGWHADVATAWTWLGERVRAPRWLWGHRLGCVLAADVAVTGALAPDAILLWQPVVSGRSYFNQWLRLARAQRMTQDAAPPPGDSRNAAEPGVGAQEVAGYVVAPALIDAACAIDLAARPPPRVPVVIREVSIAQPPVLAAATARLVEAWSASGATLDARAVPGPSFWIAQEIEEAVDLVADSAAHVAGMTGTQR